jgi:fatty acid desaturase
MRTHLSQPSRALRSGEVIVRFFARMIVLLAFAAISGIGFAPSLAMLLWMCTILSAGVAAFKRELPFADTLNHWDEAAAYIALCCLVESLSHTIA